ncbi:MAG: helix-turn-helix transcriptional regulator [Clostridia bacterium]|nr:helix-turn-helix transcriptional regulator [Clostridia bacterium]
MLKEELGEKLKELRLQLGISQRAVAAKLGVAQPVYQRFEKGIFECNYEQLKRLCDIYDVSADYLLGRKNY